ncbi:thiolase family protein [Sporichthya brevicatena]|uniref:Thiolase family protein n=1 Tax=Sporichthya brevicatena TaxID=171442 RepID=A0ABP3RZ32_9ACTN
MSAEVYIVGAGIHPFGRHEGVSGADQAVVATRAALADAGLSWDKIEIAVGGSNTGKPDSLVARLGLTGVAFTGVRNGCATGGVALAAAANALRAGAGEVAAVVGFDKHERGAFASDPAAYGLGAWYGSTGLMVTTQYFAMRTRRYLHEHAVPELTLAQVAARASRGGAANPNAWRRRELSVEEVLAAPMVSDPLTNLMFCQPNEGAVALILARGSRAFDLCERPVRLAAVAVRTRGPGSFEVYSPWLSPQRGGSPTVAASTDAFRTAGITAADVQVAQVQDTDCGSELIHLAETGLCADGEQTALLADGSTEVSGRLPINTDGGCLANGEPIGASGLRQVHEIVRQLQGRAAGAAVPSRPSVGFTHVYGAPGVSACTVLTTEERS